MTDNILTMKLLKERFGVCRLSKDEPIPKWINDSEFVSITRTADELSIVCVEHDIPDGTKCERNWRVLKVEGPLDFSLIGILASISTILARNDVSLFAISTYDTDYILVKSQDIAKAVDALGKEKYEIVESI